MQDVDKISALRRKIIELSLLVNESARLEHAVYTYEPSLDRECWVHFVPTRFVYSVFTFNMLYSINWKESINKGRIIEFDSGLRNREDGVPESKKMSEYFNFCFSNDEFMEVNKVWFKDTVLKNMTPNQIVEELNKIRPDVDRYGYVNRNGNIRADSFIKKFQESVYEVIIDSDFSEENIYNVYNFIYKIRCNIFHGVKTITEMMDPDQQKRLEIYSRFLYAANSMVFRYLNYLQYGPKEDD